MTPFNGFQIIIIIFFNYVHEIDLLDFMAMFSSALAKKPKV